MLPGVSPPPPPSFCPSVSDYVLVAWFVFQVAPTVAGVFRALPLSLAHCVWGLCAAAQQEQISGRHDNKTQTQHHNLNYATQYFFFLFQELKLETPGNCVTIERQYIYFELKLCYIEFKSKVN